MSAGGACAPRAGQQAASPRPQAAAPRVYGRRIGRPLRPAQQAALATLLPALRLERPEAVAGAFPRPAPLLLEIGFGGGEHFATLLRTHPEANLLGSEVFLNGLATLLAGLLRDEAATPFRDRVRLWPDDARLLLPRLPEASLDQVFLLFPDPWPKARHAGRRILQPEFLARLARVLKPEGRITLATDDPVHRAWVSELLAASRELRLLGTEARTAGMAPRTRYEAKAFRAGRHSTWWVLAPVQAAGPAAAAQRPSPSA